MSDVLCLPSVGDTNTVCAAPPTPLSEPRGRASRSRTAASASPKKAATPTRPSRGSENATAGTSRQEVARGAVPSDEEPEEIISAEQMLYG